MTEVSASDPHGANAQFLDWINHSACQQQTGHGCHQETGHEQYYGEKNRTVERRVGLAFGQFDEHQPTEWRNLRVRSEHRMTEDIFSIGSLNHRRIETATSKLDLGELRDIDERRPVNPAAPPHRRRATRLWVSSAPAPWTATRPPRRREVR